MDSPINHVALKKIIKVPNYTSNHKTCTSTNSFIFKHKINLDLIRTTYRILKNPCEFVHTNYFYFKYKSLISESVKEILYHSYDLTSFLDNDLNALKSRVELTQQTETLE